MSEELLEGVRVMVVEDDALIGLDLQDQLETLGASVIGPVPCVSMALETLAADGGVDCATLDVSLGKEQVFPVADELRDRGIPFVFVTSFCRLMLPDEYQDVPCCGKPLTRSISRLLSPLLWWTKGARQIEGRAPRLNPRLSSGTRTCNRKAPTAGVLSS